MAILIALEVTGFTFISAAWRATLVINKNDDSKERVYCWAAILAGIIGGAVGAAGDIFNPPYLMNQHRDSIASFYTGKKRRCNQIRDGNNRPRQNISQVMV